MLATVAAGLYVSWNGPLLIPSATRLQGIFFWDLIIYLIEGFVFLLTGLQARTLLERMGDYALRDLAFAIAGHDGVVIVARFVWVFPAVYLPRWLSPSLARRDPAPPWQWAFRRSPSPACAASSRSPPRSRSRSHSRTAQPFPHRDLILFITFGVIIFTWSGSGLLLPAVIRWLGLAGHGAEERRREGDAEQAARQHVLNHARGLLDELAVECRLSGDALTELRSLFDRRLQQGPPRTTGESDAAREIELRLRLIGAEREVLHRLLREGRLTDESRRRLERELDLEEAYLSMRTDSRPDLPL